MSAFIGRKFKVLKDGVVIAGVRSKSNAAASAPVDVTDINSAGYREFLVESGELSFDVSVEGVTKSTELRDSINNGTDINFPNCVLEYEDGYTTTGDVILTSLTELGVYNDSLNFTAELSFNGQI